jgi:broad specificity phosphatase PhoE
VSGATPTSDRRPETRDEASAWIATATRRLVEGALGPVLLVGHGGTVAGGVED